MRHVAGLLVAVVGAVGVAGAGRAAAAEYAHPELLAEPADLAKPEAAKQYVVLDVRARKKYEAGHVPGARNVDHPTWVKAFADGADEDGWAKRIGALGITPDSRVVLYDDTGVKDAAQIWWLLRYWGVTDARLLNGGWQGWKDGGHPVEAGAGPEPVAAVAKLKARPERLATKGAVLAALKQKDQQLLDARSEGEFTGAEKFARRAGAIPGAVNMEWTELLDPKTQRFKSADELTQLFRAAGVDVDKPVIAYCQSGRRSSVTVFALELLGAKGPRNYFASWFEWGNDDDAPIAPGKPRSR